MHSFLTDNLKDLWASKSRSDISGNRPKHGHGSSLPVFVSRETTSNLKAECAAKYLPRDLGTWVCLGKITKSESHDAETLNGLELYKKQKRF